MADEHTHDDDTEETEDVPHPPDDLDPSPNDTDADDSGEDDEDGDEPVGSPTGPDGDGPGPATGRASGRGARGRLTLSAENLATPGTLVLHFQVRSVTVGPIDGDAAMRLLYRLHHGRRVDWITDSIDPVGGSARDVWLLLAQPDEVLAVEWHPGHAAAPQGVAIDPVA